MIGAKNALIALGYLLSSHPNKARKYEPSETN